MKIPLTYVLAMFGIAVGLMFIYFNETDLASVSLGGGVIFDLTAINTLWISILSVLVGCISVFFALFKPRKYSDYSTYASMTSAVMGFTTLLLTSPFVS